MSNRASHVTSSLFLFLFIFFFSLLAFCFDQALFFTNLLLPSWSVFSFLCSSSFCLCFSRILSRNGMVSVLTSTGTKSGNCFPLSSGILGIFSSAKPRARAAKSRSDSTEAQGETRPGRFQQDPSSNQQPHDFIVTPVTTFVLKGTLGSQFPPSTHALGGLHWVLENYARHRPSV